MLESVPNFSEGRDRATIEAIGTALDTASRVLDVHADLDHNRSVFTVVAGADQLVDALASAVAVAVDRIDLRSHKVCTRGSAPPTSSRSCRSCPSDFETAQEAARALGPRLAALGLPVFVYAPPERGPAFYRRGGPAIQARLDSGELAPDFGPARLHPTAGGVIVGARRPLIALNVNLRGDFDVARAVARAVRERDGGLPGVRALGLDLSAPGVVQVSMNIEDWERLAAASRRGTRRRRGRGAGRRRARRRAGRADSRGSCGSRRRRGARHRGFRFLSRAGTSNLDSARDRR